jgi:hypothetical protein
MARVSMPGRRRITVRPNASATPPDADGDKLVDAERKSDDRMARFVDGDASEGAGLQLVARCDRPDQVIVVERALRLPHQTPGRSDGGRKLRRALAQRKLADRREIASVRDGILHRSDRGLPNALRCCRSCIESPTTKAPTDARHSSATRRSGYIPHTVVHMSDSSFSSSLIRVADF